MGVRLHVRSLAKSGAADEVVYEFDQARVVIGRGRGADVCLPHRAVSLRHASIEGAGGRYTLTDHDSTNGTRVGDARIVPGRPKPLRDGDRVVLGGFSILFRSNVAVSAPTSAERTASLARRLLREALEGPEDALRPALLVLNGPTEGSRRVLPDPPARLAIGRGEQCELVLPDADASREHAELEVGFEGVRLRDLGSKNGVSVGGRPVRERLLADRDEVTIGATVLRFDDPAGARVRELEAGDDETQSLASVAPPDELAPTPAPLDEPAEGPEPLLEPEPAVPARAPRTSIAAGDALIYVLASVVFGLSALALLWLLRA
jgi:pSer/pThr/pTyr-binding forkhead associated (FHA) protein